MMRERQGRERDDRIEDGKVKVGVTGLCENKGKQAGGSNMRK